MSVQLFNMLAWHCVFSKHFQRHSVCTFLYIPVLTGVQSSYTYMLPDGDYLSCLILKISIKALKNHCSNSSCSRNNNNNNDF